MIMTIVGILLILWLLGLFAFPMGGLIHILLVVALVVFIYDRLVAGRRAV